MSLNQRPTLTIERAECILVDLPTIRPHQLSMTTMRTQTLVLVRVYCSDGVVGEGEGTTIGGVSYGAESPESIKTIVDTYLTPMLVGADPRDVSGLVGRMDREVQGNHFARTAVETALWDAQGKRLGLPVSELLGGRQRDLLPVAWTLASGDTARDIAEAEEMLARRRHRDFKLKIGAHHARVDVAHVAAIAGAIGERGTVRVDVNQAWDETTARWGIAALEDAGVILVEQPLRRDLFRGMARLSGRFTVPIMADESLAGPASAFELARQASASVFAVKLSPSGGLKAAQKVAAIGEAAGLALYGGTMLEGGIGTAAAAQVCSTFGSLRFGTELFGPLLLTEELLETPLEYRDFALVVPSGPGLGVHLDPDRLAHFRRDATRTQVAVP